MLKLRAKPMISVMSVTSTHSGNWQTPGTAAEDARRGERQEGHFNSLNKDRSSISASSTIGNSDGVNT